MKKYSTDDLEQMLWDSHESDQKLRLQFYAYIDPRNADLVYSLSSVQKAHGAGDWIAQVNLVMEAMCTHDAGLFPVHWLHEIEDDEVSNADS